ncbi:MAG: response regulator [Bacteroidota bacterium]
MEQTSVQSSSAYPKKVLIVDDNVINQKVAAKMLQRLHIEPDILSDGQQAVDAVKAHPYDLILMDVQMPVMDGLEATRTIRVLEAGQHHTIIVAVTANAIQGDRERCLESGMDDYLPKPIKQQDIEQMIAKWFNPSGHPAATKPAADVPAAVIDPVRIEQIMEIGDESLLTELFTLYLDDLRQYPLDILAAHREGNFSSIYENSHKLKGSSANIGVESIRGACIVMEQCAKERNSVKVLEQLAVMQDLIGRISHYIRATYAVQ